VPVVDFATFVYAGDAHRLHAPGQLQLQVESNNYPFDEVLVIHQLCNPMHYEKIDYPCSQVVITDIDMCLIAQGIDIDKPQYSSSVDKHHTWKNHVVNHLVAVDLSDSDYIVFADNDCWMVRQPSGTLFDSWVQMGIEILDMNPEIFIVSPNDGEPERRTQVISQQMFMARTSEFREADFNQPGYSGNPRDYPEMPEYHAMLEGRIHYYCKATGKYRYVLPPEYRYWHWNRTTQDGMLETDMSKY
jgi:hypothetical protein